MKNFFNQRKYIGIIGNRSVSDNGSYISCVQEAVQNARAFASFKHDKRYRAILEHVTKKQGDVYLEIIKQESPFLITQIDDFKDNDLIGGSITYDFQDIGHISPSTLRYVKVVSDLMNLFGEKIGGYVAEIGVGYGGQLLVADKVFNFKKYDLFDLPPVLSLASKYIESHILNGTYQTITLNQHQGDVDYDLVISNYAFSELPSKLQHKYVKKILSKAKRGYLTMNSGQPDSIFQDDKLSLNELRQLLPKFEVLPERPLTARGNYLIVWGRV